MRLGEAGWVLKCLVFFCVLGGNDFYEVFFNGFQFLFGKCS